MLLTIFIVIFFVGGYALGAQIGYRKGVDETLQQVKNWTRRGDHE